MQASKDFNPILGIMSGTSLDGVDLALCLFQDNGGKISYSFLQAETVPLTPYWQALLAHPFTLTAEQLAKAHVDFGRFLGQAARTFLHKHRMKAGLIASHGQTLFHKPGEGYTFQLGHGAAIAHESGVDTVCDFRTGDVVLGGQGAPFAPMGDELLFGSFDGCLNLGGFSNISCRMRGKGRIGFDISPVNFVLNHLAAKTGQAYDEDGLTAASGNIIPELLQQLDALPYYAAPAPKSLGAEWVNENIFPLLAPYHNTADLLRTFTEHAVKQIANTTFDLEIRTLLCTGGGARNKFFIQRLKEQFQGELTIPDRKTIDFKEALIFALLGYLRAHGKTNVLSTVTGASLNSCAGAMYKAFPEAGY